MALPNAPGFIAGPATRRPGVPVLFLDRDGVVNVNHGYVHTPERTEWVTGVLAMVAHATRLGYQVVVATNQAGIARGLYTVDDFTAYTRWQQEQLAQAGASLLGTWFCPHHPQAGLGEFKIDCLCRKPHPGMLLKAIEQFAITPGQAVFVGDKISDMQAGAAAGLGRLFLLAGDVGEGAVPQNTIVVPDLTEVQRQL